MATDPKPAGNSSTSTATRTDTSSNSSNSSNSSTATAEPTDAAPAREATDAVGEAVGEALRQGQDAMLRSVRMGTELLTRLSPFTLLAAAGGDRNGARSRPQRPGAAAFPVTALIDEIFELVKTGLGAHRRYVDHLLAAQRQLLVQVLDTGAGIAATQAELARGGVTTLDTTLDTARSTRT